MPEEKNPNATTEIQGAEEYAAAIKHLKENTVSKEQYEKVVNDNKVLTKALAGEGPIPEGVQAEAKRPDIKELRKKFLEAGEQNLTNAETVQTALQLRDACLEAGEPDPFLPVGIKNHPSPSDIQKAQDVADAFQNWLDEATDEDGVIDAETFNAMLRKGIADDSPLIAARLRTASASASKKRR